MWLYSPLLKNPFELTKDKSKGKADKLAIIARMSGEELDEA